MDLKIFSGWRSLQAVNQHGAHTAVRMARQVERFVLLGEPVLTARKPNGVWLADPTPDELRRHGVLLVNAYLPAEQVVVVLVGDWSLAQDLLRMHYEHYLPGCVVGWDEDANLEICGEVHAKAYEQLLALPRYELTPDFMLGIFHAQS